MNKTSAKDEELLFWHHHIAKMKEERIPPSKYCKRYNLNQKKFVNMQYRLYFKSESNPQENKKLVDLYCMYKATGALRKTFCEKHNISESMLGCAGTHYEYSTRLKALLAQNPPPEDQSMNFVQVAAPKTSLQSSEQTAHAEVIEPQNDIEIMISKGVKVLISPNIDSMKIIKIIELLKDL